MHAVRVDPNTPVRLAEIDPRETSGADKEQAARRLADLGTEMAELHDLLFFAARNALLVVLQGQDTSGKDGLIRHLLGSINAQSTQVVPFKAPSGEELAHDFLWRIHRHAPRRGDIALFNRSHYEDVVIVRVHGLVPEPVWRPRFEHIRAFERMLIDSGTIVLKFFLHISREEQLERLLAREQDPVKSWKLSVADWQERERWDDYQEAWQEAIEETASEAPWFIVPADRKWLRNLAVTERIVEALRPYRDGWMEHLTVQGEAARAELERWRESHPEGPEAKP